MLLCLRVLKPRLPDWWKWFWWKYTGASSASSQAAAKVRSGHTWLTCMKEIQRAKFQAVLKWTKMKMSRIVWEMKLTKKMKKILQKMSVLLPVYRMLQNRSLHCCDVSPSSQSSNPYASHSCEVNTLFGEAAHLQLEEPSSAVPTSLSYSKSKDEKEAQSMHLGLCCVSSVRTWTLAGEIKTPKAESRCKNYKNQKKARCDSKGLAHRVKDACALKLASERTQHFCNACNIALKLKDAHKIHEKGRDVDRGLKCVYCCVTEWDLMENHLKSHKRIREAYQCLVCESVLLSQSAWKVHRNSHQRKCHLFQCTIYLSSFETEQIRNLHVACHYQDMFKCPHSDFASEKPLKCEICSYASIDASSLQWHFEPALVRGPTNVDSVHIVAFRRRAWNFTYADITLVRHSAVVFAAILPLTSNFSENTLGNITWVQELH
ncbi:zinc finger protein 319-like isoform X1 [Gymnogyps californianus]|uniref:zinc finger protein 319-like isoform X1 n=1 Tax=Gymnogyps californianus TaxID=33616 RepID=UPI0021C93801|nr:zinc finger protein 319-like isoform X1 [Gymnogyps californianus]